MFLSLLMFGGDAVNRIRPTRDVTTSRIRCRHSSTLLMPTRPTAGCVRKNQLLVTPTVARMKTRLRSVLVVVLSRYLLLSAVFMPLPKRHCYYFCLCTKP